MSKDESTAHWLKEANRYKTLCTNLVQEVEDLKQELGVVVSDRDELQEYKDRAEHFAHADRYGEV